MQQVHCFACVRLACLDCAPPVLARIQSGHATALKPTHKAGRRGGESIARQRWCVIIKIIV
ncbi:hypothetical protein CSP17_004710 [Salmonella enterica subsp. arizonae]|uniref:Uncharacterized protein n=2 Tax=Salmonella enterica TaxID=28901 RepID=A0A5Y3Q811_SALER|nr:hypothetical protein [Salmonella enterica]ECE6855123.1 hypothetical protein [Salmonella enterica subsp. arizonae]ECE6872695.1 hypothetical protein [Salmonella enterica subsp. houtenae]ECU8519664.1 hypothetical protein [Salmonella enterica subsp. arizonae serovar 44:z4,z23,z32:-]EDU1962167.1 hypothetical protein [Salmonella enterica subsp. arizonae serovar 53:z4,z23:-]EDW8123632.1 hypothetical protein [Salmonella enterica subsp. salamae]EDY0807208.1 hypothetical protein [Salmonella enterica